MDPLSHGWFVTFAIVLAAMVLRSTLVIGAAFAWIRSTSFAERRRIYRFAYAKGQLGSELKAALLVVAFDALLFSSTRYFGLIDYAPAPSWGVAIYTYLILFVWIEIWFYVTHRAMHHPALYRIHRQHHVAKVTDPLTSLSFSLGERAVLLVGVFAFAILVSKLTPLSFGALIAVGLTNYVFNVLGHSNVEFVPEWIARSAPGRLIITPSFHAMHHARYKGHYGLYTTILDRWFGTAFDDYEAVYDRARSGAGLSRPGERVKPAEVAARA